MKKLTLIVVFLLAWISIVGSGGSGGDNGPSLNPQPETFGTATTTIDADIFDLFEDATLGTVYKWMDYIYIKVYDGEQEEIQQLNTYIQSINTTLGFNLIKYGGTENTNVDIYFVDEIEDHPDWNCQYTVWFDGYEMIQAEIQFVTGITDTRLRDHLMLELLTGGIGLPGSTSLYANSIWYAEHEAIRYSDEDKVVIQMLYNEEILPGMNMTAAREILVQ